MKKTTQAFYRQHGSSFCPVCQSKNTMTTEDGNCVFLEQQFHCDDCDSQWTELYKITGYKLNKKGERI
mgnify:FL=1|tara:strand:- start:135 stop:338 length:204 start_codon:yes stop_codon:yes gene_type:complete